MAGLILGFFTALMGREGIRICTAAAEGAVHRHLDDQLFFLREKDTELHALIVAIQAEELHHLDYAEERITTQSRWGVLAERVYFRGDRSCHLAVDMGRFHQNSAGACRCEKCSVKVGWKVWVASPVELHNCRKAACS